MIERIRQKNTYIIGPNIKRLRKERGLKSVDLIAKLQLKGYDISADHYSKIEKCRNNPTVELIILLKEIFNCTYDDFFIL